MAMGRVQPTTGIPTTADPWFDQYAGMPPPPGQPATPPAAPGAAPPPPAGGSGPAPGSITDPSLFRDAWFASPYPKTTDGLKQFVAANPQFKATITGSKGSKVLIGGYAFQAVRSAGINGGIGPAWDPLGPEGGSGPGGESGSIGGPGGMDFGSFAQGFQEKFKSPTIDEMRAMPGYQFAREEGLKAIDTGAAAHGTLLTGGNQKDRATFATGLADQTGQTKYQNALGEYMNAYSIFRNNQNDVWGRYDTLSDRGTRAADSATS